MTPHDLDTFAKEFTQLIRDGQNFNLQGPLASFGLGIDGRIQEWIQRALDLAKRVRADNVTVTGGFPLGLSVSVGFSVRHTGSTEH